MLPVTREARLKIMEKIGKYTISGLLEARVKSILIKLTALQCIQYFYTSRILYLSAGSTVTLATSLSVSDVLTRLPRKNVNRKNWSRVFRAFVIR